MLGLFPIAGSPIASAGGQVNTNGGALGGASSITALAGVAGQGSGSGTSVVTGDAGVVGRGDITGASLLAIFQAFASIVGSSSIEATGLVVGRAAGTGASTLSAVPQLISLGGKIIGSSTIQAFAFYPAYTAWETEKKLFDYNGELIEESDSAFEQAGRIMLCAQRTILGRKEVWLYWFNSLLGGFVFEFIAAGRNPRVILDDPFDTTNSDVLLFYVTNDEQRVVYRQQRDRFGIEFQTPRVKDPISYIDLYLQDVVKDRSGRLVIITANHTINAGTWAYDRLESALYPFVVEIDPWQTAVSFLPGSALDSITKTVFILGEDPPPLDGIPSAWLDLESFTVPAVSFLDVSGLIGVVKYIGPPGFLDDIGLPPSWFDDVEPFTIPTVTFESGTFVVVVIDTGLFDLDEYQASATFESGTLIKVVIDFILFDIDAHTESVTFIATGSSLAP